VKLLTALQPGSRNRVDRELVDHAMMHGHLDLIGDLAKLSPKLAAQNLAVLAVANGRTDLLEGLIAQQGRAVVARFWAEDVAPAILQRNDRLLDLLLSNGLDASLKDSGVPLLVMAAEEENEYGLGALLRAGAKASAADGHGTKALMVAAGRGSVEGAKILLAAQADPRAKDRGGMTALHYATAAGHAEIAAMLLGHGARCDRRDNGGRSSLDLALRSRAKTTVAVLVEAGARLDVAQKSFNEALIDALALDQVELVERAVADGWSPTGTVFESYTAGDLAAVFAAKRTQAYLQRILPGAPSGGLAVEKTPDSQPQWKQGSRPLDPRSWDRSQPALSVTVSGVIDEKGRCVLPGLGGCEDPRIARAILGAVPSWQFVAAEKNGRQVKGTVAVAVNFPAHDSRIFAPNEVDTLPAVKIGAKLESSVYRIDWRSSSLDSEFVTELDFFGRLSPRETTVTRWTSGSEIVIGNGEFAVITFIVEPNGHASHAAQITGSQTAFRSQALGALGRYRFEPGTRGGLPVRTQMTLVLQPDLEPP